MPDHSFPHLAEVAELLTLNHQTVRNSIEGRILACCPPRSWREDPALEPGTVLKARATGSSPAPLPAGPRPAGFWDREPVGEARLLVVGPVDR